MNTSLIAVAQGGFYRLDLMVTNSVDITAQLFDLQDKAYADFQSKLLPTVQRETVIGVRTPDLRKMAIFFFCWVVSRAEESLNLIIVQSS